MEEITIGHPMEGIIIEHPTAETTEAVTKRMYSVTTVVNMDILQTSALKIVMKKK